MLLVGICSLLVLDCREWRWISWTRIHAFHHGLACFSLIFFNVVLSKLMCISVFGPCSSPSNSFAIFFIHSAFSLCSLGCYIVRFLLHPVVGMFSCHLYPVVGRIFFPCFWMSRFVCIVLPVVNISLIFLLSPVLSGLFPQVVLLFFLVLPLSFCLYMFHRLSFLACFRRFLICVSSRISHPGFYYYYYYYYYLLL